MAPNVAECRAHSNAAFIPSEIAMTVGMSDLSVSALAFAITAGRPDHSETIVLGKGEPGRQTIAT
jgi:hypothetical protein